MDRRKFLALLGLTSCCDDMSFIINPYFFEPVDTWVPPTLLGADTVFFFSSSRLKTMFQEVTLQSADNSIGVPITPSDADGESVGLMYDSGPNALKMSAASNTVKPTMTSGSGRNTGLDFSGTQYLRILNSQSILKNFHKANTAFSIFAWVKKDVDGTAMVICSNIAGSSLNHGIYIATDSSNKILILGAWGSSGNFSIGYASTATFTVADGWTPIIVTVSGSGATAGTLYIGDKTPESFTVDNEGSTSLATGLMTWGATSSLGSFFNGQMDDFGAQNRVLTAGEIANYKAYNPSRDNSNFAVKEIEYDFNDTATMWADTGKTTPITDGVGIAAMTNKVATNFGPRTDDLTQSTAANRPLYQAAVINGLGVGEYDGVNDTLTFSEPTERGGAYVAYVVIQNIDNTNGSRPLYGNSSVTYWVLTGDNYSVGVNPRSVVHKDVGSDNCGASANNAKEYNVLALRIYGDNMKAFGDGGEYGETTSVKQFAFHGMGFSADANWFMHGNITKFIKYNGYKTDAQIAAEITTLSNTYN